MKSPASCADLDSPERIEILRSTIRKKAALRAFYEDAYRRYNECLSRCPAEGIAIELGSGGGFAKERVPGLVTSDVLPYAGVDKVVDATKLPFGDASVRAILMLSVFHHIPDVGAFLEEATRCLIPGGRVFLIDHHMGWFGSLLLRHFHHERCDPASADWSFRSAGPLSDSNTALTWIVFSRDRAKFEQRFPKLAIETQKPHSPLFYWLAGGLRSWTLIPGSPWAIAAAKRFDLAMMRVLGPGAATYMDIELVRQD